MSQENKPQEQIPDQNPQSNEPQQQEEQAQPHANATTDKLKSMLDKVGLGSLAKPIVVAAIGVVALIIVVSMFSGKGASNVTTLSDSIIVYYTEDAQVIAIGGQKYEFEDVHSHKYSLNQGAAAVLEDYSWDSGGTLYYVTQKDKIKISDDVALYEISNNGKAVAYLKDVDRNRMLGSFYLFDADKKKSEKIAEDVTMFTLSPNGKSVAYVKDFDYEYEEFDAYIKINGKSPEKLGTNLYPFAIADGGKYVYYAKVVDWQDDIGDIYVKKGKSETRLRSKVNMNYFDVVLNNDFSQIIMNDDGKSYFSKNGGDAATIGNYAVRTLMLPNVAFKSYYEDMMITVYGVKNLTNMLYYNDNSTIIYLDSKGDSETIERRAYQPRVSANGSSAVYKDDRGRLNRKSLKNADADPVRLADNVRHFVVSPDGNHIYYVDDYDELFHIKGNGKPKKISGDVDTYSLTLSSDGSFLYYLTDYRRDIGTLYQTKNGGKPKKIADDVHLVQQAAPGIMYFQYNEDDEFDLYYTKNHSKFEQLDSNVYSGYSHW